MYSELPLNQSIPSLAPTAEISLCDLERNVPARITRIATPDSVEEQHIVLRLIEIGFLPGEAVRVQVTFSRYPGLYLYHCHILEHEDMGMMRNFRIHA